MHGKLVDKYTQRKTEMNVHKNPIIEKIVSFVVGPLFVFEIFKAIWVLQL